MAGRPPLRSAQHDKVVREYLLRRALQLAVLNNVLAANPVRDVLSDRLLTTAEQLRDRAAEAPPDPLAFSDGLYEVIPHAVAIPGAYRVSVGVSVRGTLSEVSCR